MLINVVGWYGQRNAGDDAFRLVFDRLFMGHDVVYTNRVLNKADRIVYGGGGVMCKAYLDGLGDRSAYALGVDVHLNGPEYDRLRSLNFKSIIIRSREYADIALKQGWNEVSYAPDIAFALDYPTPEKNRNRVGIILTHELPIEKYKDVSRFVRHLLALKKEVLFIPMYDGLQKPDWYFCEKIISDFEGLVSIAKSFDPLVVMQNIASCDSILTMRFHGAVFASAMGIPFISLANKGKHSLFCEQEAMDCFLDLKSFDFDSLLDFYFKKNPSYSNKNKDVLLNEVFPKFKQRVIEGV